MIILIVTIAYDYSYDLACDTGHTASFNLALNLSQFEIYLEITVIYKLLNYEC